MSWWVSMESWCSAQQPGPVDSEVLDVLHTYGLIKPAAGLQLRLFFFFCATHWITWVRVSVRVCNICIFAYMPPPLVCKIVGETKRSKCIDRGAMNQNCIPPKVGSLMPKLTVLKSMGWGYIGFSLMPWQPFSVFWLGFPRVDLVPGLTSGRRYWPKRDRNQSSKSASFSASWYWKLKGRWKHEKVWQWLLWVFWL